MDTMSRRRFLQSATLAGAAFIAAGCSGSGSSVAVAQTPPPPGPSAPRIEVRIIPAQATWTPSPAQVVATEGIATLPGGARLWYWDTGGTGQPVVLIHAATGSGASWEYQQPVLAQAGYRVIGYSMRGKYRSDPTNPLNPGTGSGDLHELITHLGLNQFHLVGTAAGGGIAMDYAVSHQERLFSLVIANSLGGIVDRDYQTILQHLLPPIFSQLPADFRELGPSYRAGYRPGVERWLELHAMAGSVDQPQPYVNDLTWGAIASLRVPTLLLTGDADLYMPPSNLREFVRHFPASDAAIFSESGHAAHWEQPEAFNRELIRFLQQPR